jgi:hypothetical protein
VQRCEALEVLDVTLYFGGDSCGFGEEFSAVDYPYAGAFDVFWGDVLFFF